MSLLSKVRGKWADKHIQLAARVHNRGAKKKANAQGEMGQMESLMTAYEERAKDMWRQFAKTVLRVYHKKQNHKYLPNPQAMAEGLEVLSLMTSQRYALEAFGQFERL